MQRSREYAGPSQGGELRLCGDARPNLRREGLCLCAHKTGPEITLEELVRFLRDERNVSVYKLPERLELVASFPMTQVGKIGKNALRHTISEKLKSEAQDKR